MYAQIYFTIFLFGLETIGNRREDSRFFSYAPLRILGLEVCSAMMMMMMALSVIPDVFRERCLAE